MVHENDPESINITNFYQDFAKICKYFLKFLRIFFTFLRLTIITITDQQNFLSLADGLHDRTLEICEMWKLYF